VETVPIWLQVLGVGVAIFAALWKILGDRIDARVAADQRWVRIFERMAALEAKQDIVLKFLIGKKEREE